MFTEELLKELLRERKTSVFWNILQLSFWEKTYFSCGVQANRAMNRFLACMQAAGDWTWGTEICHYFNPHWSHVVILCGFSAFVLDTHLKGEGVRNISFMIPFSTITQSTIAYAICMRRLLTSLESGLSGTREQLHGNLFW